MIQSSIDKNVPNGEEKIRYQRIRPGSKFTRNNQLSWLLLERIFNHTEGSITTHIHLIDDYLCSTRVQISDRDCNYSLLPRGIAWTYFYNFDQRYISMIQETRFVEFTTYVWYLYMTQNIVLNGRLTWAVLMAMCSGILDLENVYKPYYE